MVVASPLTSKFFLARWVYVETIPWGRKIDPFKVSKLYAHGDGENIWFCDFEDSYLCKKDTEFFGKLIDLRYNAWVKIIGKPIYVREHDTTSLSYQACYFCIEGKDDKKIEKLRELFKNSKYNVGEIEYFPWYQDTFVSEVATYCDKWLICFMNK